MLKNVFFAGNETCEQSVRISVTGGRRFKNGDSTAGYSKVNIRSEARPESHGAMRLNVTSTSNVHKQLVACVGRNAFNEQYRQKAGQATLLSFVLQYFYLISGLYLL